MIVLSVPPFGRPGDAERNCRTRGQHRSSEFAPVHGPIPSVPDGPIVTEPQVPCYTEGDSNHRDRAIWPGRCMRP